jgi:hypothetical protein
MVIPAEEDQKSNQLLLIMLKTTSMPDMADFEDDKFIGG